jgi:hypothetical protein
LAAGVRNIGSKRSVAMQGFLLAIALAFSLVGSVRAQEVSAEPTATPEEKQTLKIEHERLKPCRQMVLLRRIGSTTLKSS